MKENKIQDLESGSQTFKLTDRQIVYLHISSVTGTGGSLKLPGGAAAGSPAEA